MNRVALFLRGVNVSGRRLKMAEIVAAFEKTGMKSVRSLQASGNFIASIDLELDDIRGWVEQQLLDSFDLEIPLFVKTKDQLQSILEAVPFAHHEDFHRYVFLTKPGFETVLMEEFEQIEPLEGEMGQVAVGTFYWRCPKGVTLDAGFSKILGKKKFRDQLTSRNITTIEKVYQLF